MVRARRVASAAVAVVVLSIVAAVPVAAAPQSITEELIRGLNRRLLYIAVPIALLVEFILLYTVWRFRDNDDPEPTRTNRDLEITWTVATALVLLFVGSASFAVLTSPYVAAVPDLSGQDPGERAPEPADAPPDAVVVEIVAEQWNYSYEYANGSVTTDEELVVPENRTLYLYVTAEDVLHSVHVPELGLKQDAFPNQYNLIRTRIGETGEYRLYCAEFCGAGHAGMRSTLRVVGQEEYREWLDERQNETSADSDGTTSGALEATRP
ncbi:cytochrome c oxidase subunit II [Natronoarchaeum mannanilyticum]|uniref:cytochrome-c oxidase n=1 Tax=Natronoarchaeum mannanilyticum TaxID=926360 RepID=A0AAV3TDJ9_9EURY